MSYKAAIDFGNSNTVLAVWDENAGRAEPLSLPGFSAPGSFIIPSVISYETPERFFIGEQALRQTTNVPLFRWMKRYINLRSPYRLKVGEERIDAQHAAEDFLQTLLAAAFPVSMERPEEIAVSVPTEAFEDYSDWLLSHANLGENTRLRILDEAAAAAAGYGLRLKPGDTVLTVDFGGSTLQTVCAAVQEETDRQGRCCRVLGKAGANRGGMRIDRLIYEDVLRKYSLSEADPRLRSCSGLLLRACEELKVRLSEQESAELNSPLEGMNYRLTRDKLTALLRNDGLLETLDHLMEEALRTAETEGFTPDRLTAVLPVGGGCRIPAILDVLRAKFGTDLVASGEPLGAVARGAAAFAGGMHIYDFIRHDYAIRFLDPRSGEYAFRVIVPRGTRFPVSEVSAPLTLKASYDGQTRFGIAIYEMRKESPALSVDKEIIFDTDGSAGVMALTAEEKQQEQRFWVNQRNPTFLESSSPAQRGIPRFRLYFGIDEYKMLTVCVRDLLTDRILCEAQPVIRLF